MRQSLTIVTCPSDEPVTLSEAKAWAKIDLNDDDALIPLYSTTTR